MNGFFVTGTDTGVGKTHVTEALARCARTLGKKVFAFKPVESGCELLDGELVGADMETLARAAGNWQQGDLRGLFRLRSPVAPFVAASEDGVGISLAGIRGKVQEGAGQADVTLVEGAGGWRVPLTASEDIADLARDLGLPVVIVCRATLGTINHSRLTIEAVERDGCRVGAVVLSRRPEESLAFAESNAEQIRQRWSKAPVVVYEGQDSVFRDLF
jgi:dethiobiotin synthetase